jgi:predicted PurR-regulated permease PerM
MDGGAAPRSGEDRFLRRVLIVTGLAVAIFLLWTWRNVALLLFLAILIAVGLHGIAKPIAARTPLSQGWALALAGLIVVSVLAGIGWLFGAQVGAQIVELSERLPEAVTSLQERIYGDPIGARIARQIEVMRSSLESNGGGALMGFVQSLGGWTMAAFGGAVDALVVIFAAAFFAIDPRPYREGFLLLLPRKDRPRGAETLDDMRHALARWLLGTLISMAAIAVMVGGALWLIGVPAFLALALIAGFSQLVPLIGPIAAAVPGILIALTLGPEKALWTAIVYLAASQIEANLVTPIVQKRAISMPPAVTLFAILGMGVLFGPLGVILALPLAVVVSILVVRLYVNDTLGEHVKVPGR